MQFKNPSTTILHTLHTRPQLATSCVYIYLLRTGVVHHINALGASFPNLLDRDSTEKITAARWEGKLAS
jgi:hypothetical protein